MSEELREQVVVVTGGLGTLGRAVGKAVSEAGAHVVLLDRAASVAAIPGTRVMGEVNLADRESAGQVLADIAREQGRIDALVNVAGTFRWETIEAGHVDTWDLLYQVNLRTAFNASQAALPYLLARASSRIVNIGAGAASKAGIGLGAYAASKSGVSRLTEAMAEEFKDRGLTVNAVLPSIIDTAPNRADMPNADFSRWVQPSEIADLIVYLLSGKARSINGALIPIAGRV